MRFLYLGLILLLRVNAGELIRDYLPVGGLSAADEKIVLQLARNKGITNVAAITTYYIAPSSYIGISVKEEEKRVGYKVKYRVLNLSRKGWVPSNEIAKTAAANRIGDFTADYVLEAALDTFVVGDKEFRISLQGGISRSDAKKILRILLTGKVEFHHKKREGEHLEVFDLHVPFSISRDEEHKFFTASFARQYSSLLLIFTIKEGTLIVSDISITIV